MSLGRRVATTVGRAGRITGFLGAQRLRRRRRGDFCVFVLEYHGVCSGPDEPEGFVSAARLGEHVRWLRRHGFAFDTVAGVADRLRAASSPADLGSDWVALSFDDGYADNHDHAFPVLEAEGVPATVYLVSGFLDGAPLWFDVVRRAARLDDGPPTDLEHTVRALKRMPPAAREAATARCARRLEEAAARGVDTAPAARPMSWQEARRLRDAGWELGAHTVTHPILSRLDAAAQEREIVGSRARIVDELGPTAARTFAVPNGSADDYDDTTLGILDTAGFAASCTTRRGGNRPGDDLLQLRRHGIGAEPTALLELRLAGALDEPMRRRIDRVRRLVAGTAQRTSHA